MRILIKHVYPSYMAHSVPVNETVHPAKYSDINIELYSFEDKLLT